MQVVVALQPLVSRETSPTDSAVVSVSEFNTGATGGAFVPFTSHALAGLEWKALQ